MESDVGAAARGAHISTKPRPPVGPKSADAQESPVAKPRQEPFRIAIVGGGPKGLYGLERLAAQLADAQLAAVQSANRARSADQVRDVAREVPVEIHIFNRTPFFGSGDIYRPDQPNFLLINFCIGNITQWIDEQPPPVAPAPRSLTNWLRECYQPPMLVNEQDFVSRACVGRYLEDGFQAIVDHLPAGVHCRRFVGEVVDLIPVHDAGAGYQVAMVSAGKAEQRLPMRYQRVLLATGHPRPLASRTGEGLRAFCRRHPACAFVPFIYPVSDRLAAVAPEMTVAIKGMGLTFVDAVLALTEGRGGRFERDRADGALRYCPSGAEPAVMLPFSRTGLPMHPRGPEWGLPPRPLLLFNDAKIQQLRRGAPARQLDFEADLWPLLRREMLVAFYGMLLRQQGTDLDIDALEDASLRRQIERFHRTHPEAPRFTPEAFLDPLTATTSADHHDHHRFVLDYLATTLSEARRGGQSSPWMAAVAVWRDATPLFGELVRNGVLTPGAQRTFDQRYRSPLNRVTFGPPIVSMEKVLAVARAGLIDFGLSRDASLTRDDNAGGFRLDSGFTAHGALADVLVDARIPKVSLQRESARLYQNLRQRRLVQPYDRSGPYGEDHYRPGCMALSPDGYVIDANGRENRAIAATGTPTEGVTYDNDSLSRTRNNFVSRWAGAIRRDIDASRTSHDRA